MNRTEFNKVVEAVFDRTRIVLVKKGDEYSSVTDVFHNFNNSTGISLHDTNTAVAWEFLVKHLQSIKDIITKIETTALLPEKIYSEHLIDEKFGDAINYLILIEGMLKEKLENPEA
jgi:hypothetical protein